ncbi:hypothetical protein M8J75_012284 [Diaphorina citri]|nr:hypothetical protein M8J75_012284 [Diaphorina citri]
MEREKISTNNVDEYSPAPAPGYLGADCGYVPPVGRWGSQWPPDSQWPNERALTEWPDGHPLPLPQWDEPRGAREPLSIPNVEAYEDLVAQLELAQQQLLARHNYNSVGNFVKLYEGYKSNPWGYTSLSDYYQVYKPPISASHHTCVGLAFELLARCGSLEQRWPGLSEHLNFASCEEAVKDIHAYVQASDDGLPDQWMVDKEHVVVYFKFILDGRLGYAVMDQGYHVARVVTVMVDGQYPHTGDFTQQLENNTETIYSYAISPSHPDYIVWTLRSTNHSTGKSDGHVSLIYVGAPFCSPVDVTERRNLVYEFRSIVARDTKGTPLAGLHFKVKLSDALDLTVFYRVKGEKVRVKIPFARIQVDQPDLGLTPYELEAIDTCNKQLHYEEGKLRSIIISCALILRDTQYVSQMLDINETINELMDLESYMEEREE